MKNARKSSADIHSTKRQISRQCCGGWSRARISQTERQQPATASPRCAERGRTRRGSAGLTPSNDRRKAMIDHIYLPVSDLKRSSEFYKKVLEPLGSTCPTRAINLPCGVSPSITFRVSG